MRGVSWKESFFFQLPSVFAFTENFVWVYMECRSHGCETCYQSQLNTTHFSLHWDHCIISNSPGKNSTKIVHWEIHFSPAFDTGKNNFLLYILDVMLFDSA